MGNAAKGLLLAALVVCLSGAQEKTNVPTSDLKFRVLRESSGRPIRNASVILHEIGKDGKQGKGELQTKTDAEGKCALPAIPYGKLRVQVIAKGFQTFGQDYDIAQPAQEFVIRLKPPQEQYTIYK